MTTASTCGRVVPEGGVGHLSSNDGYVPIDIAGEASGGAGAFTGPAVDEADTHLVGHSKVRYQPGAPRRQLATGSTIVVPGGANLADFPIGAGCESVAGTGKGKTPESRPDKTSDRCLVSCFSRVRFYKANPSNPSHRNKGEPVLEQYQYSASNTIPSTIQMTGF